MSQISTDMEFIPYKDITLGQVWQYAEEYCVDHCGQLMVDDACLFFMTENSDQPLSSLVFDSGAGTSCEKIIHHITALVGLDLAGRSMALMSSNSLIAAADTARGSIFKLSRSAFKEDDPESKSGSKSGFEIIADSLAQVGGSNAFARVAGDSLFDESKKQTKQGQESLKKLDRLIELSSGNNMAVLA